MSKLKKINHKTGVEVSPKFNVGQKVFIIWHDKPTTAIVKSFKVELKQDAEANYFKTVVYDINDTFSKNTSVIKSEDVIFATKKDLLSYVSERIGGNDA